MLNSKKIVSSGYQIFLTELHDKIRNEGFRTKLVNKVLASTVEETIPIPEGDELGEYSQFIKETRDELLIEASKNGEKDFVDFFIKCEANVNYSDEDNKSAIDFSCEKNYKNIVLQLLQADSRFPKENSLDECFQELIKERNILHEWIQKGNLEEVKLLATQDKSRYYFNRNNQSAAFTALEHKEFDIYGYLVSINAGLYEKEKEVLNSLGTAGKNSLRQIVLKNLRPIQRSHISFLLSKTRYRNSDGTCEAKVEQFYNKLNLVSNIAPILKVLQYADKLEIIFDFNSDDVEVVCPLMFRREKGVTLTKMSTVYVSAGPGRKDSEILGTVAHELSHMALELVFRNNSEPYEKLDGKKKEWTEIIGRIQKEVTQMEDHISETVINAFKCYDAAEHSSELIVRVPHILAQFDEEGEAWLKSNAEDLFQFYCDYVIPKCRDFINRSYLLQQKSIIRYVNEDIGEINNFKKCNLRFRNISRFRKIFAEGMKYYFLVGNSRFCLIKILQSLYGKRFVNNCDDYILLKFENCMDNLDDVQVAFHSEVANSLILDCFDELSLREVKNLMESVQDKSNKKIIFVVHKKDEATIEKIINAGEFRGKCKKEYDADFSLNELDFNSQDTILQKRIEFQGVEMSLGDLIGGDEALLRLIDSDVVGRLFENERVRIGSDVLGTCDLEGAYAQMDQEINIESMTNELKGTENIFIFCDHYDKKEDFINILRELITYEDIWIQMDDIDLRKYKINTRRILFLKGPFVEDDFKIFCRRNPLRKIYVIKERNEKLMLQHIFNPQFYLERKFEMILIDPDKINQSTSKVDETIIITPSNKIIETDNFHVKWLDFQEAKQAFEKLSNENRTVHWLIEQDNQLIWYDSNGRLDHLRNYMNAEKFFINEKDLMQFEKNKKTVIIADDPGMGKSTTLTKLYESGDIIDSHWIIRINLKDHIKAIKAINEDGFDLEQLILLSVQMDENLNNGVCKNLLRIALSKKFSKTVLFAFDGFDELLDESDRNTVIFLLKYLKESVRCKFWITTRLHYKRELEDALSTFALHFHWLNDLFKMKFVKKYLNSRLNLTLHEKLCSYIFGEGDEVEKNTIIWLYSRKFISKMKSVFKGNVSRFIGTPLQLHLMLEDSLDHFVNWISEPQDLDFSYLGNTFLDVYDRFIHGKFRIYFKKFEINQEKRKRQDMKLIEKYHKDLAESLTCENKSLKPKEDEEEIVLLLGIVKYQQLFFEFIHTTFREYYFAQVFTDYLTDKRTKRTEYLLHHFLFEEGYELIRNFINIKLENERFEELPTDRITEFCEKIKEENHDNSFTLLRKVLHVAISESNNRLFEFYWHVCEQGFERAHYVKLFSSDDKQNLSLHTVAGWGNIFAWKLLTEKLAIFDSDLQLEILSQKNINHQTVLHEAIFYGYPEMFQLFFETFEKILSKDKIFELLNQEDESGYKYFILAVGNCMDETCDFLLEKAKDFNSEQFVSILTNRDNLNALHEAARGGYSNILERIFEPTIPAEVQYKLLSTQTHDGKQTALEMGVEADQIRFVTVLLQKLADAALHEERFIDILLMRNENGSSILHCAVKYVHLEMIELILHKADELLSEKQKLELLCMEDSRKQTIFHIIALVDRYNNYASYLWNFNELEFDFTLTSIEGFLEICVKHHNKEFFNPKASREVNSKLFELLWHELRDIPSGENTYKLLCKEDDSGHTPLHLSTMTNCGEMVKCILQESCSDEQFELLCRKGLNGQTALHWAIALDNYEITELILETAKKATSHNSGLFADFLNINNKFNQTPLHWAAAKNHTKLAHLLLENMSELGQKTIYDSICLRDIYGQIPLHSAVANGNYELFCLFLKKIKEISLPEKEYELLCIRDRNDQNIMHRAVMTGCCKTVTLILKEIPSNKRKEYFAMKDKGQQTPLAWAFLKGNFKIYKMIINNSKINMPVEDVLEILSIENRKGLETDAKATDYFNWLDPRELKQITKLFYNKNRNDCWALNGFEYNTFMFPLFCGKISKEEEDELKENRIKINQYVLKTIEEIKHPFLKKKTMSLFRSASIS